MGMKYTVIDIEAIGIDVSQCGIPDDWQRKLIAAGCPGRVPLERYPVDGRDVMVVYNCDTAMLE